MRMRDESLLSRTDLTRAKQTYEKAPERQDSQPALDPRRVLLVNQWKSSNPWYDPTGATVESQAVNAIDAQVMREGFDPNTPSYYKELTRRVSDHFGSDEDDAPVKKLNGAAKKKAPPQGQSRDGAAANGKIRVVVTPERKDAMIKAGVWDDPKERAEYLKEFAKYDREQSANR